MRARASVVLRSGGMTASPCRDRRRPAMTNYSFFHAGHGWRNARCAGADNMQYEIWAAAWWPARCREIEDMRPAGRAEPMEAGRGWLTQLRQRGASRGSVLQSAHVDLRVQNVPVKVGDKPAAVYLKNSRNSACTTACMLTQLSARASRAHTLPGFASKCV
jgi:hypothetical protein